jgi:uncharacterized protein (TIGR03382 family)
MMVAKLALTLLLAQYVRSKVSDTDPQSQCLWWPENSRIEVRQNADGSTENNGAEFGAVTRALTTWQTQLNVCSSLNVTEGPRTSTRKAGYVEKQTNENIALFRVKKCSEVVPANDACLGPNDDCGNVYDCWQHQSAAIAITTTSFNSSTGRILDSDIEFNAPFFLFTTVDSPPCPAGAFALNCVATDLQNTATHEFGHFFGLAHLSATGSTMNANAGPGETSKRRLDPGTAQFVCDAYPKGKPSKTCVLKQVTGTLGKPAKGCSTGSELLLPIAVLWLGRRRRLA